MPGPFEEDIAAWARIHGWDPLKEENQILIWRQVVLNKIIRQIPGINDQIHPSPLDSLEVELSQQLVASTIRVAKESQLFNFWGELYSMLIPQPRRRKMGQFWTSDKIAEWMVSWLLQFQPRSIIDVGCGSGSFLLEITNYFASKTSNKSIELCGWDVSPLLLNLTVANYATRGIDNLPTPILSVRNFIDSKLPSGTDAVICNPPYTRHHHISPDVKDHFRSYFQKHLNIGVSRLATLALYFLLKTITEMSDGAHAAFIVPMEVLDARYGLAARKILCQKTTVIGIIHFAPEMNAFPNVDVGASILLFRKGYTPGNRIHHITLTSLPTADELLDCLRQRESIGQQIHFGELRLQSQDKMADQPKWFTIPDPNLQYWRKKGVVILLKDIADVVRGIATGANDFFVLSDRAVKNRLLSSFVVRTIHRNREIQDILLDEKGWQTLSAEGKRVWLLYLSKGEFAERSQNLNLFFQQEERGQNQRNMNQLQEYLAEGEEKKYHQRSLVQTRKRWYLMEQREIPPIFYTLLTRGNPRFILNRAGVRPLNMFLLIYPKRRNIEENGLEILWALLNSSFSISRLHSVSRTYGGKTLKVEPGELRNLPIINPDCLKQNQREKIKEHVQDYFNHRQSEKLVQQVNSIVKEILG
ncbi:MAG: class I SAM-dependent DNA methyltransferase [Candidatus Heimdallarchaeota archaeon]